MVGLCSPVVTEEIFGATGRLISRILIWIVKYDGIKSAKWLLRYVLAVVLWDKHLLNRLTSRTVSITVSIQQAATNVFLCSSRTRVYILSVSQWLYCDLPRLRSQWQCMQGCKGGISIGFIALAHFHECSCLPGKGKLFILKVNGYKTVLPYMMSEI